jgi:hydroxyacylglutathione hydrolase
MSYSVTDTPRSTEPWFVLTGDCLFVGDAGRADLVDLPDSGPIVLYHSIQRLLSLSDLVEIYPAHYGGSACGGKAMSGKASSTIGFERRENWALQYPDAASFASETSSAARTAVESVLLNRNTNRGVIELPAGYFDQATGGHQQIAMLNPTQARQAMGQGAVLIDLRTQLQFASGHPTGAINIAFNKETLAKRVMATTAVHEPLILIGDNPLVAQTAADLLHQHGRNQVLGYLAISAAEWIESGHPNEALSLASLEDLHMHAQRGDWFLLDVREPFEWEKGVIETATLISLGDLRQQIDRLPRQQMILIACESGTRASTAISMLRHLGFERVQHMAPDGMSDYAKRFPTVHPATLAVHA